MPDGTMATRRGSNPRFDPPPEHADIPATPPAEARPSAAAASPFFSIFIPPNSSGSTPPPPPSSSSMTTAAYIAAWYLSNISVLLLNKYLLSIYGYRYPIFLTALHMLACAAYSAVAVRILRLAPLQRIQSRRQLLSVAILSAVFSLSVVAGNASLRYLPVSFNQAVGSTTPLFTAAFAFLLTWRREHAAVYLALLPVVLGIAIASRSEPLFHPLGFAICIVSTAGRALKSVFQGILLGSESERLNSMNLLMYMAPMAAAMLIPASAWMEGGAALETAVRAASAGR